MSFNKFLNNKSNNSCDFIIDSDSSFDNRNCDDYFFNKSDLEKMNHFTNLTDRYKLCNKIYYYFNMGNNLWVEEKQNNSIVNRICEETSNILVPEKKYVVELLSKKIDEYASKKNKGTLTTDDSIKFEELKEALKEFNKFIDKAIKEHQKTKFAKSVIEFFNHKIIDEEFTEKININNQHLLPLRRRNMNLKTGKMEDRKKEQYFTQAIGLDTSEFDYVNEISEDDDYYKIVDKFFLDICTGSEVKKQYLQKILGYFISGNVKFGRCFYIFFGDGKNGKSAIMEIMSEIMRYYCKAVESSIIVKRGKKNAGQASPELVALDYGVRLAILSETEEGEKLNEELIKNITGGDSISYRALRENNKSFVSEAKLCMLTNNKPYFQLSQSMVDRIRFLDFKSRFISEEPKVDENGNKINKNEYRANPDLVQELKTTYKAYVLKFIINGAIRFFSDGNMNVPNDEELIKENMSYINEMDSYKRFCDECFVIDNAEKVLSSVVHEKYKKFCTDEGIPPISLSKLKQLLLKQFPQKKDSKFYYYGFRLDEEPSEEQNDVELPGMY